MLIAADIGNTNISICVFREDATVCLTSLRTFPVLTCAQYAAQLRTLLELEGVVLAGITHGVIASVAAPVTQVFAQVLETICGRPPLIVSAGVKTGLKMRLSNAGSLGADMVCAAVGAVQSYPLPAVIADLGTATTITGVDREGVLVGRTILAGVGISLQALKDSTAALPLVGPSAPAHLLGMDTADAIRSGITYGTASMLDGMCQRCAEQLGEDATLILTGGYAAHILPYCQKTYHLDETLVLRGMKAIFDKNAKG